MPKKASILSLSSYEIAETDQYKKKIRGRDFKNHYVKIRDYVYPQLRNNPFFSLNIKKLKGEFKDVYRYRIGNIRLFYIIEKEKVLVMMIEVMKRKDAY
jgi:mRNA interferase RelE/StbE